MDSGGANTLVRINPIDGVSLGLVTEAVSSICDAAIIYARIQLDRDIHVQQQPFVADRYSNRNCAMSVTLIRCPCRKGRMSKVHESTIIPPDPDGAVCVRLC